MTAYKVQMLLSAAAQAMMNGLMSISIVEAWAYGGATAALTTAWEGLTAVMDANPLMLIVIAIVAIVAGFVMLYKHCKWFRDFVKDAMKDIVKAFHWFLGAVTDTWKWIKQHWPLLLGIITGPIGLAIEQIITHWKSIEKLPGKLLKLFKDIGNDLLNAIVWPFKTAFQWVSHHLPSFHVHHIGPIPIPLPSFPGLAAGGVTPYGGAFVVGEKGPELVTLPAGASVSSQQDLAQTNALLRELIATVRQNSQALVVDGRLLAQAVNRQGLLQASRS
jgi:hypothetical protein